MFPCDFHEFFKIICFTHHLRTTASENCSFFNFGKGIKHLLQIFVIAFDIFFLHASIVRPQKKLEKIFI